MPLAYAENHLLFIDLTQCTRPGQTEDLTDADASLYVTLLSHSERHAATRYTQPVGAQMPFG